MKFNLIKNISCLFLLIFLINTASANKYLTKNGTAYFMSQTDAINIDGNNKQVAAIADTETGEVMVIVLVKAFEFSLATADKHFNDTYMESDKYPKATFKGNAPMLKEIDFSKDGSYEVSAEGDLTIHGQTKQIKQAAKLVVKNGKIDIKFDFNVLIDDYKIEVPKAVENRVAKKVDIKMDFTLMPI